MSLDDVELTLVESTDDVFDFMRWLSENRRPVLGADTETSGLNYRKDALRLVQFGDTRAGWAIPWEYWAGVVHEVFRKYEEPIVFHNGAFDIPVLMHNGVHIRWDQIEDTLIMAHLLDPPGVHGLKPLSVKLVDSRADDGEHALKEGMRANKWTWGTVPFRFEPYWVYSALDPVLAARLYERFNPAVRRDFASLYDTEVAIQRIMTQARLRGALIDTHYCRERHAALGVQAGELADQIEREWGFSPSSTQQMAERLVADGVPLVKRTPKGDKWSMDKEVMAGLENVGHPLARLVLDWRRATRFRKAYFEAMLNASDADGFLHASINTLGARTGRMSVSDPPLQQIPSHDAEVRAAFIPQPGNSLLSIDFSNIEVRILAHFAQDPTMIEAFRNGEDIHLAMAKKMYGPDAGPKERKHSKSGTLGRQYGIGPKKFAIQQGVSVTEAEAFLAFYDETFPGVPEFIDTLQLAASARQRSEGQGYVLSPSGRRHTLTFFEEKDNAWYKLVNYLCQGTAADVLKEKTVALDAAGLAEFLVLPVHDELLWDAPAEQVDDIAHEAISIMQDFDSFAVPITVDAEIYETSWGECIDGGRAPR